MQTRRTILAGAAVLPFWTMAARAAAGRNSRLLLCRLSLDKTLIKRDGTVRLGASLEAREEHVRIFMPMQWGEVRGFRLQLRGADGKPGEPNFHPPVPLPPTPMMRGVGNYHELDVGESIGFNAVVKAKDIFPSAGRFRLRAIYVPEPSRAGAPIQAIVFENGSVESGMVAVTVV